MSYERTKAECSYCGERFMTAMICHYHQQECEQNE